MPHRPFRFGVMSFGSSLADWRSIACKTEDLGFSTLCVSDHFGQQLGPLSALAFAAAITSRVRLGSIVLDNDFRHPAVLAKEAATIDVLSNGRLELGLGAGWLQADYAKTGLTFDPPAVRMERLGETVQICKAFFDSDSESVTFRGQHFVVEGLDAFPKPTQRPRIMIGGRQRRMLSLAAREADIVGISLLDRVVPGQPKPPTFADKVGFVREAAGPRYSEIELHVNVNHIELTDDRGSALERLAQRRQVAVEDLLQSPAVLIGSLDDVVEQLQRWRAEYDVSYFVVGAQLIDAMAPVVARLAGT